MGGAEERGSSFFPPGTHARMGDWRTELVTRGLLGGTTVVVQKNCGTAEAHEGFYQQAGSRDIRHTVNTHCDQIIALKCS